MRMLEVSTQILNILLHINSLLNSDWYINFTAGDVRPFKNITSSAAINNANNFIKLTDHDSLGTTPNFANKIDYSAMSSSVDLNRVQQLYQIVKHGRIHVNDFDGLSTTHGAYQPANSNYQSVSSMHPNNHLQPHSKGYSTL